MQNKLRANKSYMPTKFFKKSYVQSRVAGNALAQISTRVEKDVAQPFTIAKEMLDVLTAAFGNKNWKRKACIEYRALRQGGKELKILAPSGLNFNA